MSGIVRSLVLLLSISGSVSFFVSQFSVSFWATFLFVSALQMVGWRIYTYYQEIGIIKKTQELQEQYVENVGKQQAILPCASCGHENTINVELHTANTFECEACNVKNAVYINIETASMTVIEENE